MNAVYLLHLKQPYRVHHRHVVASIHAGAGEITKLHRHLTGGRLPSAALSGFVIVRVWKHCDQRFERLLKKQKHHSRLCPVCNPTGYAKRTKRMRRA